MTRQTAARWDLHTFQPEDDKQMTVRVPVLLLLLLALVLVLGLVHGPPLHLSPCTLRTRSRNCSRSWLARRR